MILVLLTFRAFAFGEDLPVFTVVTEEAGIAFVHNNGSGGNHYFPETVGSGCGWIDADGDGWLDLYFVNACDLPGRKSDSVARNVLYHNNRDGTFTDVTDTAGVGDTGYGVGCAVGDYDGDGDADLFVANMGPNRLYRNRGDGTFDEVGGKAGVDNPTYSASAAFLDYDRDGHLDLYVANYIEWDSETDGGCTRIAGGHPEPIYCAPHKFNGLPDALYHNNRDGTFTDVSSSAGIDGPRWNGLGVVCGDYDQDGDTDVYVGNDASPNLLWLNQGDGTFVDDSLLLGVGYGPSGLAENGMGVAAGDYDRDGRWDLAVNNFQMQSTSLYRGTDDGFFEYASSVSGLTDRTVVRLSWGLVLFDYDNDGWEDLFVANGHIYENIDLFSPGVTWAQTDLLFRNLRDGAFALVSDQSGEYFQVPYASRGAAAGDYDNDGDLDLAISMNDRPAVLLRNDGGNRRNWIAVQLQGTNSNRDGVGARVAVEAGGFTRLAERRAGESFASSADPRLHFGLDDAPVVNSIRVEWLSGAEDVIRDVTPNQLIHIVEGGT